MLEKVILTQLPEDYRQQSSLRAVFRKEIPRIGRIFQGDSEHELFCKIEDETQGNTAPYRGKNITDLVRVVNQVDGGDRYQVIGTVRMGVGEQLVSTLMDESFQELLTAYMLTLSRSVSLAR